jgi:hypothetical protein
VLLGYGSVECDETQQMRGEYATKSCASKSSKLTTFFKVGNFLLKDLIPKFSISLELQKWFSPHCYVNKFLLLGSSKCPFKVNAIRKVHCIVDRT